MKPILTMIGILLLTVVLHSCYTHEDDNIGEAKLVISVDPEPGSTIARTLGTTYDFRVAITSRMPPRGVDITVAYTQDSDNSVVFTQNYLTTTASLPVTITNIPFNEVGTVTVTATSRGRATNTATKTFKLVRK